jgi:hypothetical protein
VQCLGCIIYDTDDEQTVFEFQRGISVQL